MNLINTIRKKPLIKNIYLFFVTFGFNPIIFFKSVRNFPRFIRELFLWKKYGGKITRIYPILNDYQEVSGVGSGQYFHQDLLIANYIYEDKPKRHVDVASRIDGFVAHVASFREVEVYDVRKLNCVHKNIIFRQVDFMNVSDNLSTTDSLSCLHSLEHFGLGRYSDAINVNGLEDGVHNLIKILKKEGKLYISLPIGIRDEVHFNAQRISHPETILKIKKVKEELKLINFDYVDNNGDLFTKRDITEVIDKLTFGLGIYTFKKI